MAKRGRKEKDNWKKKRRQEYLEKKEFRYYIFCEGQATEPKYFQGFKRYIEDNPVYRDMVLIEIEGCQAGWCRCRKAFGEDAAVYNTIFSYFFGQNQQFGVNYPHPAKIFPTMLSFTAQCRYYNSKWRV